MSRAVGRKVSAGDLIDALPVDKLHFEVIGPPAILNFQKDFGDVFKEAGRKMKVYNWAMNNGLLPVQITNTKSIEVGDELEIDLDARSLASITRRHAFPIAASDGSIQQMKRGGFLGYVRERLRQKLKTA